MTMFGAEGVREPSRGERARSASADVRVAGAPSGAVGADVDVETLEQQRDAQFQSTEGDLLLYMRGHPLADLVEPPRVDFLNDLLDRLDKLTRSTDRGGVGETAVSGSAPSVVREPERPREQSADLDRLTR